MNTLFKLWQHWIQGLSELRSLQKPDQDVEDLMACIIMILKSSNSDLTWSKGAKRQMANLDRFIDELMNFDDTPLPQVRLRLRLTARRGLGCK